MTFICTPSRRSPPVTPATCCSGERPIIHMPRHTDVLGSSLFFLLKGLLVLLFLSTVPIRHFSFVAQSFFWIRWMLPAPRGAASHGLSHARNDWVASPATAGIEKCLSHLSTSSRRRLGKRGQGYCFVDTQSHCWTHRLFLRVTGSSFRSVESRVFNHPLLDALTWETVSK